MSPEEDLEMSNFQGYFMWLMKKAKDNAPANNGISIKARRGDLEAEITYSPPVIRYSRGGKRGDQDRKKASKADLEGIVAEYPGDLELGENDTHYLIRYKKYPFADWQLVMDKVNKFTGGDWGTVTDEPKKVWSIPKG